MSDPDLVSRLRTSTSGVPGPEPDLASRLRTSLGPEPDLASRLRTSTSGVPGPEPDLCPGTAIRSTTVLCVRRKGKVALGADGQVSMGNTIVKGTAVKVRSLARGKILAGFAGSAADGLTLCELLEAKLDSVGGNFTKACVELAKDWRLDRRYRRLEALLIVADRERSLLLSGTGDVIEAEDGVLAIGSGGNYALSAARALLRHSELGARELVEAALGIAGEICVFTNASTTILELESVE